MKLHNGFLACHAAEVESAFPQASVNFKGKPGENWRKA
jgi:hypothetical protein